MNKPTFHCARPILALPDDFGAQSRAKHVTFPISAAVKCEAIRSYPDRAWCRWMSRNPLVAIRNHPHALPLDGSEHSYPGFRLHWLTGKSGGTSILPRDDRSSGPCTATMSRASVCSAASSAITLSIIVCSGG
jgi:hypothetical protein